MIEFAYVESFAIESQSYIGNYHCLEVTFVGWLNL